MKLVEMRREHGVKLLHLFQVDNIYKAYGESARTLDKELGLTRDSRGQIDYVILPTNHEAIYFAKLVRKGYKIAIHED